ncbi:MAG: hypothetical protein ABIJ00_02330 [Candidatus Eisenbacteria bacterium]
MKNEIPVAIAFAAGMLMVVSLFVPHPYIAGPAAVARSWAIIITAFAYVLGVANIARISVNTVRKKSADWEYKTALLVALAAMAGAGIGGGIHTGGSFDWTYLNVYVPMQATMFSLLAFFIASAAFRAFRARSVEATLLLVTAAIVMLGRVPVGEQLWGRLPDFTEWIMEVPNMAAKRGIMIGAALGAISTGLKMILGLERSYLGGE